MSGEAARAFTHGQVVYLQIPALDIAESAVFYARVFGWDVEPPQSGFQSPGLIGQWVTDRPLDVDGGLVAWIAVDDIDATLDVVRATGGTVLEPPTPDGPVRWLATFADPAGNLVGIAGHGRRGPAEGDA
jgi:uncharacterized protein